MNNIDLIIEAGTVYTPNDHSVSMNARPGMTTYILNHPYLLQLNKYGI